MILCIPVNNKEDNVCISHCKSKQKFCFSWNELTNPTRLYHISWFCAHALLLDTLILLFMMFSFSVFIAQRAANCRPQKNRCPCLPAQGSSSRPGIHGFHVHALGDTTNSCMSTATANSSCRRNNRKTPRRNWCKKAVRI